MPERLPGETAGADRLRGPRALVLALLAFALLLAAPPDQVRAQSAEADVFVAKAIVAYDEKRLR